MNFFQTYRLPFFILIVGGLISAWAFHSDHKIRQGLVDWQGNKWNKSSEAKWYGKVRVIGDWPPLMGLAVAGYLIARVRRNQRWSRIILAAMIASTIAGTIANASRLTTGRTRPRESPKIEQGFYGPYHNGRLLIGQPAYNSFPSGHTATAFGFAAVIVLTAPVWGVPALAVASTVAWASIALGAHHPSDVTVSITLAFLVGWFVCRFMKLENDSGFAPNPVPLRE